MISCSLTREKDHGKIKVCQTTRPGQERFCPMRLLTTSAWGDAIFVIIFAVLVFYSTRQEFILALGKVTAFLSRYLKKRELPRECIQVLAKPQHSAEPYRWICDDLTMGKEQFLLKNIDEVLAHDVDIVYAQDWFLQKYAGTFVDLKLQSSSLFNFKKIHGLKVELPRLIIVHALGQGGHVFAE